MRLELGHSNNLRLPATAWMLALTLTLTLALALTLPALADVNRPPGDPVVAEVEITPSVVLFHPVMEHEGITLTVAGDDGCIIERSFKSGETPYFEPFDEKGKPLADCTFTYELRARPVVDPGVKAMLVKARKAGDSSIAKELRKAGKLPWLPPVQAGYFTTQDGRFLNPKEEESRGQKLETESPALSSPVRHTAAASAGGGTLENMPGLDFVINDDLIVDGSACIGFDCVNGEVFSFDTIRLKENNLRIKFDDTSVAASFPRNDWQLTANESANGGASKFSIEDISGGRTPFTVEANARSHSLYVDDGGRIGSRTSTPSVEIHTIDGDTPTLRLQQDGSSGFEPQTWDVAGNETNFFVRDVTNGSALPFRIRPGAPSSSIFINTNGDVGLGTSSPNVSLHVLENTGVDTTLFKLQNNGGVRFQFENTVVGTGGIWQFINTSNAGGADLVIRETVANGTEEFRLTETGNLTISGELTTSGSCSVGCDVVFSVDYPLPSIEEHASEMWANSYLPAVGPTAENGPFNLTRKVGGILNELEKAHIYIEQLNITIRDLRSEINKKDIGIESMSKRLENVEKLLSGN